MSSTFWSIFLLSSISLNIAKCDGPIVQTIYGKVEGTVLTTDEGNEYYAFLDVPYASPPIDDLRFQEPVPPKNWTGVLNATRNNYICHQINRFDILPTTVKESEDCLYLNVYTPMKPSNSSPTDHFSVLVWIHGGGFKNGEGAYESYGPHQFIDENIVVVTINYRLGPLGFLTTADGVIPANLGLRDQNFALQWIQSNIEAFGGDPSKVTISGESAGAVSVGFLILSKKSEGLFRAAILQSGTAIASFSHQLWPEYYAFETAKQIDPGFNSTNSTELLEFLQSVPTDSITTVNFVVSSERENGIGSSDPFVWAPVIEDETIKDAFITGFPDEDIKNGNLNKVPILIGYNSEEQFSFVDYNITEKSQTFDNDLELLIHNKFNLSEENKTAAGAELRSIYTNGTFEENYGSIIRFLSDESMTTPAIRQVDLESQYTDVYLYEFGYKGLLGFIHPDIEGFDPNAVGHAEDVAYLWHTGRELPTIPDDDLLTRKRFARLWSNFVKYLNPTPVEDELLQNVTWPKVSSKDIEYLSLNRTLVVKNHPKEYRKWEKVYDKYTTPPLINY